MEIRIKKRVKADEGKILPFYAGQIWKRPAEQVFNGACDDQPFDLPVWSKAVLSGGDRHFSMVLLSDVLPQHL